MYARDQKIIAAFARQSPHNLRQVGLFVQATINTHFEQVPQHMADIAAHGRASKFLTTSKRRSFDALTTSATDLHDDLIRNTCGGRKRTDAFLALDVLRSIVELPGFGIVKAGFWVQLVYGDIGCLDRHNLRAAGMDERTFHRIPASAESLTARLESYIAVCDTLGGSAYLWDSWCQYLSILRPKAFPSADYASAFHVYCVTGEWPVGVDYQA